MSCLKFENLAVELLLLLGVRSEYLDDARDPDGQNRHYTLHYSFGMVQKLLSVESRVVRVLRHDELIYKLDGLARTDLRGLRLDLADLC